MARLDKRQKNIFHTDIVPHSANTSEIRATKKPHNYHKIAVWQKDDRIRKSPLKFYVYHYSEPSRDCQASIFLSFCCLIHETLNLLCWIYTTFISIFLLQFTETQVNHRVRKDRKYRITLCCSLILTFIKFITWHCCKEQNAPVQRAVITTIISRRTGALALPKKTGWFLLRIQPVFFT